MFRDRTDAGHGLAEMVAGVLAKTSPHSEVEGGLVLGLPRGGVPVAAPVAVRPDMRRWIWSSFASWDCPASRDSQRLREPAVQL